MTEYRYKVIDYLGCGKVAFYIKYEIILTTMKSTDFVFPDGANPVPGDLIRCGVCGNPIFEWRLEENE